MKYIYATLLVSFLLSPAMAQNPAKIWQSSEAEDYRIKRKEIFEFTRNPELSRNGDLVSIRFAVKDFCDATVVVELSDGTILRHLAAGVLGANAPAPFQPNSLEQTIVWDGKNDKGEYLQSLDDVTIRVSLGLRPQFERTLFWHPNKLVANRRHPRAVAQPEGVYVYDGGGVEQIKLFSHEGHYIRTVYPFAADKVGNVKGLGWNRFADGHQSPRHIGYWQATFLPSGTGMTEADYGTAARAFAVHDGRIAVVPWAKKKGMAGGEVARLRTDGAASDESLLGGVIDTHNPVHSAAFSPDGKWLYLTGPYRNIQAPFAAMPMRPTWTHVVYRMEYGSGKKPVIWLGEGKAGKGEKQFNCPSSVCVDAQGRVYIADNHNDRVQIFSADGALVKSLPVKAPAVVQIHHKTQELWVFGWTMAMGGGSGGGGVPYNAPAVLRVYDPFKNDKPKWEAPIPLVGYRGDQGLINSANGFTDEMPYRATLNSYTEPATIWMVTGMDRGRHGGVSAPHENFQIYRIEKGAFVAKHTLNNEVVKAIGKWQPPAVNRQRLLVNPTDGMLYSMEERRTVSASLLRVDPESGKISSLQLPFHGDDAIFDYDGTLLLRCDRFIGRFDPRNNMREVPFDYGEERGVRWDSFSKGGKLISGIVLPGNRAVNWFECGMGVNPRGEILVSAYNSAAKHQKTLGVHGRPQAIAQRTFGYMPPVYRGRRRYHELHIFDRHGKLLGSDAAAQGAPIGWTTLIDARGDIYFQTAVERMYDGKSFHGLTGTLIKFKRGKGRFIAAQGADLPLDAKQRPPYKQQVNGYWVEDAEWIYPGVGFSRNSAPCTCWNSRLAIDTFGRSFVPSYIRAQVAVLDTNGNLMLQVGRYGNVDDGRPLVEDQAYRQEAPQAIGGDEVALMYPNFTAVHTDRRLFISDTGNSRILSVKLGYHTDYKTALKDVQDNKGTQ